MEPCHLCPAAALSQGLGNVPELPKPNSQGEVCTLWTELTKKCFSLCFVHGLKVLCLVFGIPDGLIPLFPACVSLPYLQTVCP